MRRNEKGVTLLELLIAMMLLATALIGLAASFPLAMFGVTTGGFQTTATLLAQQCVELAKNTPYDRLPDLMLPATPCTAAPVSGFTRATTVQVGVPTASTTTVTIVVQFTGESGPTQTSVWTIFAR